jgi:hypothetical protein
VTEGESRSKFGRADRIRMQLMSQFQAQVPHPLRHELPALLPPGRVRAPTIGVLFVVFICQSRLKGAAMQIQLDDIGGGKPLLWQCGEEEFVDDTRTRDANRTLFLAGRMGGHNHATPHALGPYRNLRAIVEAAHDLTFWTLCLRRCVAINTTSPNHKGVEGIDTEEVWMLTAPLAILVIWTSLRIDV